MLRSISISGWKSFSPNRSFTLDGLGVSNLLVGANNTGKSNFGRFMLWLKAVLESLAYAPNDSIMFTVTPDFPVTDAWLLMEDTTLLATLEFDVLKFPPEVAQFASNGTVRLQVERAPGVPVLVTPYIDERPILMRGPNGKILVYNTTQGSWQDAGLGAHSAAYKAFLRSVAFTRGTRKDPLPGFYARRRTAVTARRWGGISTSTTPPPGNTRSEPSLSAEDTCQAPEGL